MSLLSLFIWFLQDEWRDADLSGHPHCTATRKWFTSPSECKILSVLRGTNATRLVLITTCAGERVLVHIVFGYQPSWLESSVLLRLLTYFIFYVGLKSHSRWQKVVPLAAFLNLDTVDTLDWILLCCRAVSCNVGCWAAPSPSSHCMPVASLPPQLWQPQNFQTLSNVPWGATSPMLRTTEQKGAFRGIIKMLKS